MKRLAAEKLLEANMASEERVENKRFLCRLQLEARERDMEQALFQVNKERIMILYRVDSLLTDGIYSHIRKMKLGY